MEAAAVLRPPHVTVAGGRLLVDGLVVDDARAVELIAGSERPVETLLRVVETGARVLDREQAGSTVELFRADLEKSTAAADAALTARVKELAEGFAQHFESAFGAEGAIAKELARHFGDESSAAVQHRIRALVEKELGAGREQLVRQFSSADATNPLADFKAGVIRVSQAQVEQTQVLNRQITELRAEVAALKAEREKVAEVAAEHALSTAKGRPYEEAVFDAVEAMAAAQGDLAEAVGDAAGFGGRKGDVVVGLDGCAGPARCRIVVEAKHSQVSRNAALEYLDEAMAQRDAAFGIWVVPSADLLPARTTALREINGDKLFTVYEPGGSTLELEVAYKLARARVVLSRRDADGLDGPVLRAEVERALGALEDERRIKAQLTSATTSIADARKLLESMATVVRNHLREIDRMVAAADGDDSPVQQPLI